MQMSGRDRYRLFDLHLVRTEVQGHGGHQVMEP